MRTGYLFRGINGAERQARALIPRTQGAFAQHPRLSLALPFTLGESASNAVRNHQKYDPDDFPHPTSGISTTRSLRMARYYATHKGERDGIVVAIDIARLDAAGLKRYDVTECGEVMKPEDEEVVLYDDLGEPIPWGAVVANIISVRADEGRL